MLKCRESFFKSALCESIYFMSYQIRLKASLVRGGWEEEVEEEEMEEQGGGGGGVR